MREILDRLKASLELWEYPYRDPFRVLVATVLSQNTNWQNAKRAYDALLTELPTPKKLSEASLREIQKLIKPAGLHKNKSRALKEIAQIIQEEYEGDLRQVLRKPIEEAREELTSLSGVGSKTADCVLLFAGGRDVLPVDTHVARTSKRLGFADLKDTPEKVREKLEPIVPKGRRGEAHILLIELGRTYCKARNPNHSECPVEELCPKIGVD
ncbi:hypothetical protein AKJ47_00865 [candidate division MSBL1 archaeon SCGC-AAA261G05]|uniref:thymine-DNA glycosylase n=2 Tax=candidate division MSBL1 TaxID=215777 RepID=A0A133V1P1_9EURY|nr:hypothetical protein AKJ42_01075 [candidate division MSBL1 archaeon SCGC-AAA261C02]KXB04078.1 hypothetical protein AKJ47_00865 [candidate division MSBL1 archaeon SCGC-AAA261G05]